MKKVRKKTVLDKIDDAINDKIDEVRENNKHKKQKKKDNKEKKNIKREIYDYEEDMTHDNNKKIDIDLDNDDNIVKYDDENSDIDLDNDDGIVKYDDESSNIDLDNDDDIVKYDDENSDIDLDNNDDIDNDDDVNNEDDILDFKRDNNSKKKDKKKLFSFNFKKKKPIVIDNDDDVNNEDDILDFKRDNNSKKKDKKKLFSFNFKKKKPIVIDNDDDANKEDDIIKKNKSGNKLKHNKNRNNIKSKNNKEKNKKKKRSLWKKIVTFVLIIGIIGVLSVSAFLGYIVLTAPEFSDDALAIKDQTVVYDINGNVIAKLGTEKRESVTYDALPQVLIDAIIATEDSRFFQHNGVDLFRFIKATALQLIGRDEAGGASTLTMQTVKNNLTKKDSVETTDTIEAKIKKVIRKFQDVYLAVFKVEKEYSKEEILEIYVNDNGLGSSYYGVEEASKYYFGKSVSDITLPEAALIAGLFQAPNRHNPYRDIDSATRRRSTVLLLMERHGYITKEEREMAEAIPISSLLVGANNDKTPYQGFIDTVVKEVEKLTDHGDGSGGDDPYTVPMKIYTTLETSIQDGINKLLNNNDAYYWKDAGATAGIAVVNVNTGAIAAVGGGRNKDGEKLFNNATQAKRQPGSTAKPLFDYGPAIEYNNYSSYQLYNDEPWTYTNGPKVNNWDNGYQGLMTMRYALQYSRNIPALKTFQQIGAKNSQKFVSSLGLDVSLNSSSENYHVFSNGLDNTINEAYSIGGVAEGFTPLEMAAAYSAFASGGYYTEPYSVTKIVYRDTGEEKEYKYQKERVMKDSTAYIMNNILESAVTSGFNGGANVSGSHVAAKTGTTNFSDATKRANGLPGYAINDYWTIAYTSQYSIGVWYGYESIKDGYNTSGSYKESLTREVMKYIPKDTKGWSRPSSVVAVTVEKDSWPAKLPSQYTPGNMKMTEYFVRGTQPTEVSERYQKFSPIDASTIKQTNNPDGSVTITWNYKTPTVLTDEYLKNYFNNSVYGNQKDKYLNSRKAYNNDTLGGFGFRIYKKNTDGNLTSLAFVTNNSYTYKGIGDTTLVIKAEYGKYNANASDGVNVKLSLANTVPDSLNVTLGGKTTEKFNVGSFTEPYFSSIKYGDLDIINSNSVTISYQMVVGGETKKFSSVSDLEEYVNSLPAGTYTINYVVTYLKNTVTKKRTIILQ